MISSIFRKTIFLSLVGHLTVFSVFNLSFGNRLAPVNYSPVFFWGQYLRNSQLSPALPKDSPQSLRRIFFHKPDTQALDKRSLLPPLPTSYYFKPAYGPGFILEKKPFIKEAAGAFPFRKRKESSLIFHPRLPYWFLLYFKDRQIAHVELMFNIVSKEGRNSIEIKRKISSGNVEVDLLTMRYIGHYLFIKQKSFTPNMWQSIKIDLSAKND